MLLPSDAVHLYNENEEIQFYIGMLDALASLPVDDVADGTKHIRDNIPDYDGESQRPQQTH